MMGEEFVSMVSSWETSMIGEISDSNSTTHPSLAKKQARYGCSSKFTGVVLHPNGQWGCQIYSSRQRIWLGTFKSEMEAATAYDSAALKLRNGDCHRNFPFTEITVLEPNFQSLYTTEALLSMRKDGTYQSKFADFVRSHSQSRETVHNNKAQTNRRVTCKQLFTKELTPSDVGKLNRLVIPKRYATKYFSRGSEFIEEDVGVNKVDEDGMLTFYGKSMKLWKFHYCYWGSSQSYVFTKGWSRFVRKKQLKANDTITFCLCECWENGVVAQTYYMIDVWKRENRSCSLLEPSNQSITEGMPLQLPLNQSYDVERDNVDAKGLSMDAKVRNDLVRKSFRLFGTEIIEREA